MARHMKHSGIEWLGDIPADWNIVQLKRLAKIQTGNTPSKTENDKYYSQESGYLWIKPEDLGNITPITSTTEYLTEDGIKYGRLLPPNTVYVCCIASVGKVGFCNLPASCNQQINGLIFHNVHWKYGFYVTIAQESEYINNASGNVMKIINSDKQSRLMCPLPPIDEQREIAAYLDDKCGRIDSVIAKTVAAVAEYKKLKQAIITRAVTRGIRPNRTLKHSGIEWIGDIPDHWNVSKIKNNFTVHSGATPKSEVVENWDGNIVWITPADYKTADRYISCGKRNLSEVGYRSCGTTLVPSGSIIFSKRAPIGTVAIAAVELCTNQGCLSCIPKADTDSGYYYYVMSAFTEQFNLFGTGTTFKEISYEVFRSFKVPCPLIDEQREIAAYLDEKTSAIDSLVAKKNQLVAELERLKKSLIFEYVTGKKEVAQ